MHSIKRTIATAGSSYVMMAVSIITSLLLIRIATQNLSAAELGLWSFCFSTIGYLLLLDFGVSNSLGRLFADSISKNDHEGVCGWLYLAGGVLSLQAVIVVGLGLALRDPILRWFQIPDELFSEAGSLWTWLVVLQAVCLPLKVLPGVLYAQNRVYSLNWFSSASSVANLLLFWVMMRQGFGVMSYAYAITAAMVVTNVGYGMLVLFGRERIHLCSVRIPFQHLGDLFRYSGAIFVSSLANQAMAAGQGMIAVKMLGLDAVAVLNITSRLPQMIGQLVQKPFSAACPRWVLQFCGTHRDKCVGEYLAMVRLTLLLITAGAILAILVNGPFVRWWTKPDFYGGDLLSVLMAFSLLPATGNFVMSFAFHLTKRMSVYTGVLLLAVGIELGLSVLLVGEFGLVGVPLATLITSVCFTFWFHLLFGGRMVGMNAVGSLARDFPWIAASVLTGVGALIAGRFVGMPQGLAGLTIASLVAVACALPLVFPTRKIVADLLSQRSRSVELEVAQDVPESRAEGVK